MLKLSEAQLRILDDAARVGWVAAYKQRRRPVENLSRYGLLTKIDFIEYSLTTAGRAALAEAQKET
jgi:hypothetical protein